MNLLVRKARKHEKEAFRQLMEQEGKSMYKIAKAILKNDEDVADAMQESALECREKIDTLKKDKYYKTICRIRGRELRLIKINCKRKGFISYVG